MLDEPVFSWQALPVWAALLCAFAVSVLLVLTKERHGHLTLDSTIGIQKAHVEPTPRVGGIAIYIGLLLAWSLVRDAEVRKILSIVLVAGIPPLAFGLAEDLTKRVGVLPRLLATMAGGVVACLLSGIALNRVDVVGLDWLMAFTPVAILFTAFAVGGVANAINIIDGFHGLASGTTIIALLSLGAISERSDDHQLALACLLVAAAIAGFWLVNYPWGKLFMGDGGAYFSGFALAWLAVLLPVRNPDVSVWAALLVCAYPVTEVLYSIVRRRIRHQSPGVADSGHLHSLIKAKMVRPKLSVLGIPKGTRNAAVSPIVWTFTSCPSLLAITLFDRPVLLAMCIAACALLYHLWYRSLAQKSASHPEGRRTVGVPQFLFRNRTRHPRHRARDRRSALGR